MRTSSLYSLFGLLGLAESADKRDRDNRIPGYVLEYAPVVYLHSSEKFWPCDIAEHLEHVTPELNYTPMVSASTNYNLTNLDELNEFSNGRFVYLTSDDNVEARPDWLGGEKNIPEDPEELYERTASQGRPQRPLGTNDASQIHGGRSDAPAVLVVIDKGHGVLDAFWFFFYSYNLGNLVFNIRFGNHVGDWEHTLVRFIDGKPEYVFVSEHFFGEAYTYSAIEKVGKRPVVYSAIGTHAMYATPGTHPYVLPLGLLHDETDRGPLWDPALNSLTYRYNHTSDVLVASNLTPQAPTEWFFFNGHWGDKLYPIDDSRQYEFVGQYHYVTGPLGPRFKHLGRTKVCQGRTSDPCAIHEWLPPEHIRIVDGVGEGEDWKEDERDPPMGVK
ncbi:Vacuolar protein sorting-associated protein 62 [Xanthoria calcicola]